MILTENGLTWRRVRADVDATTGGYSTEYRCVEFPRLTWLVQRATRDLDDVSAYHVDGLVNYYPDARTALAAMLANPVERNHG